MEIKLGRDPAVSQRSPETQPKAGRRAWNTASPANTLTTDVWSPEPRDNKYLLFRLPCVWYFAWQPEAMKTLGYSRLVTMAALSSLHEEPPFRGNQSTPLPIPFTYSKRNSENVMNLSRSGCPQFPGSFWRIPASSKCQEPLGLQVCLPR